MTDETADLSDCLPGVLAGDREAARRLVERVYPLVSKIVRAYVPREASAEEWEQEVFLRLFDRLDQYRREAPFEHWLSRLAVSVCLDGLRRRKRRELRWSDLSETEAEMVAAVAQPETTSLADALAARELVEKLLACLDAESQLLLKMLDMQGLTTAEVARQTGKSQTAVKVRAFRARRKVKHVLEKLWHESP